MLSLHNMFLGNPLCPKNLLNWRSELILQTQLRVKDQNLLPRRALRNGLGSLLTLNSSNAELILRVTCTMLIEAIKGVFPVQHHKTFALEKF